MKLAILSDIHGNAEALRSVVRAAHQEGVSEFLIAGDTMGYYFRVEEVLSIISGLNTHMIRGNHEDMFRVWEGQPEKRSELERKYGHSFLLNSKKLSPSQIDFLTGLPMRYEEMIEGRTVLMCHGSPWGHNEYIYPDVEPEVVDRLFGYGKDILIMGHTHYPVIWSKEGRVVVNPGSVGQPRGRKLGACWALWDSDDMTVALRREEYDVSSVLSDCLAYSPENQSLRDVLTREGGQQWHLIL